MRRRRAMHLTGSSFTIVFRSIPSADRERGRRRTSRYEPTRSDPQKVQISRTLAMLARLLQWSWRGGVALHILFFLSAKVNETVREYAMERLWKATSCEATTKTHTDRGTPLHAKSLMHEIEPHRDPRHDHVAVQGIPDLSQVDGMVHAPRNVVRLPHLCHNLRRASNFHSPAPNVLLFFFLYVRRRPASSAAAHPPLPT